MAHSHSNAAVPSPMANHTPLPAQYGQQFPSVRPSQSPAPLTHSMSYGSHSSSGHPAVTHTPHYQQTSYAPQYTSGATPIAQHSGVHQYQGTNVGTPVRHVAPVQAPHAAHNAYNPPRPVEVYHLPDPANHSIPAEIRNQFQRDEHGRVLFFTAPPLDANPIPEEKRTLTHSLRYLADKARAKEEDDRKRKVKQDELEAEATAKAKRMKADHKGGEQQVMEGKLELLELWSKGMQRGTDELYRQMHGDGWEAARERDAELLAEKQEEARQKQLEVEQFNEESQKARGVKVKGFTWV